MTENEQCNRNIRDSRGDGWNLTDLMIAIAVNGVGTLNFAT